MDPENYQSGGKGGQLFPASDFRLQSNQARAKFITEVRGRFIQPSEFVPSTDPVDGTLTLRDVYSETRSQAEWGELNGAPERPADL